MDLISMSLREVPADDKFRDKLPGCGDDPSFATTKSVYKINQGVKVPRVDKKDACDKGNGNSAGHCWQVTLILHLRVTALLTVFKD